MNESKKNLSSDKALNANGVSNIDGCDAAVLPQATDSEAESVETVRTCRIIHKDNRNWWQLSILSHRVRS